MTVNEAIKVCNILAFHGYGDYSLTTECGFSGIGAYPNYYDKDDKIINMEGMKAFNSDKWICHEDLIQVCDEIEEALIGGADNGEINPEYERGFKDGLKSECLKELKPFMVELVKGCTDVIKGIAPMLIDKAQLTIRQPVTRWIPCSERLPEDFSWCLVCMADGFIRLGRWNAKYDDTGAWQVLMQNGDKMYRIKTVPHWMPLPEPPEKE